MLEHDVQEQNGNVRRMLQVCAEFERIAKVVLDKAEREMRGRGKRKQAERDRERDRQNGTISAELEDGKTLEQIQIETQAAYRKPVQTPSLQSASVAGSVGASPASWKGSQAGGEQAPKTDGVNGYRPIAAQSNNEQSQHMNGAGFPHPSLGGGNQYLSSLGAQMRPPQTPADFSQPQHSLTDGFLPSNAGHPNINNPLADISVSNTYLSPDMNTGMSESFSGSFQQPFVPQDLWSMSMSLEWDMYEGMGLGTFTPGPSAAVADETYMMAQQQNPSTNNMNFR